MSSNIIKTLNLSQIITTADTQFRTNTGSDGSSENVENLRSLIQEGIPFKDRIKVATLDGRYYLVDGFHRLAAYRMEEVTEAEVEIVEKKDIISVRLAAMKANAMHGLRNTVEDIRYMVHYLVHNRDRELAEQYKKNPFTLNKKKLLADIGCNPKLLDRAIAPIAKELKERRNALIDGRVEDGKSAYAIAKELGVNEQTVRDYIKASASKKPNEENPDNGVNLVPASSHLPMFNECELSLEDELALLEASTSDEPMTSPVMSDAFMNMGQNRKNADHGTASNPQLKARMALTSSIYSALEAGINHQDIVSMVERCVNHPRPKTN